MRRARVILAAVLVLLASRATTRADDELELAVVVSRHGVRSPEQTQAELAPYASDPWPTWDVPPGYLTSHGRALMVEMGRYYGAAYRAAGLLPADGCPASDAVYARADHQERTVESGVALMEGAFPGCHLTVHVDEPGPDSIFDPDISADADLSRSAVLGRVGGDPNLLAGAFHEQLEMLQDALQCCAPSACPGPEPCTLLDLPVTLTSDDGVTSVGGLIDQAGVLAENLLLEYVEGKPDVGWGRISGERLRAVQALYTLAFDLDGRTPYNAQVLGWTLLRQVARTIEQAARGVPLRGVDAPLPSRLVVLVGHDGNLAPLGGLLDVTWLLPEMVVDQTPPGGALVFELSREGKERVVRLFYVSQTLGQMRDGTALSLATPPSRVPIAIPGCQHGGDALACPWRQLAKMTRRLAPPRFVGVAR